MDIQKKLNKTIETLNKNRGKVLSKFLSVKESLDEIDIQLTYYNKLINIKPQILFNQGREKKYVYGQVYFFENQNSNKMKSYRFIIGKMYENKSRKEWEEICLERFYNKLVMIGYP